MEYTANTSNHRSHRSGASHSSYGNGSLTPEQSHPSHSLSFHEHPDGSTYGSLPSSVIASPMIGNGFDTLRAHSLPVASPNTLSDYTQLSPVSPTAYYGSPDRDNELDSPRKSPEDGRASRKRSQSGLDYPVCCLYPGCMAKPFRRRADLDRHYKHRHAPESQKVSFNCDYPRCARHLDPFHRLDHFRDHLRDFHKEEIEKRGGPAPEERSGSRRASPTWWRCSKCLRRVTVDRGGNECPNCTKSSQGKRRQSRRKD
ncbi:hypothetical protein DCS_01720 [Drechmeria coniospora]|uniref:C2H2-type domain-containing protein n=1 Tax=Drechmeria coniospora TaxID=98403 RepID=A0A151GU53_DRECN|nr:hypothetical protein DCS_01720 [Drechmeria coniospora]KYK60583.1 hypothetical protein DCS_01720 [Drechmeria coniospora]ODA80738.1 hypothetical protein RJ55_03697 [Drechmeria coniospora]